MPSPLVRARESALAHFRLCVRAEVDPELRELWLPSVSRYVCRLWYPASTAEVYHDDSMQNDARIGAPTINDEWDRFR